MPTNQWIEKYAREQWTMPFGSLMNAYGQVNHGKGIDIEQFKAEVDMLYEKAQELIQRSLENNSSNPEQPDLPIK